jgi:hypothetical protein
MLRRTLATSAAAAAALAVSGCVPIITDHSAAQKDVIGDVAVTTKACDVPFLVGFNGMPVYFGSGLSRIGDTPDELCVSDQLFQDLAADDAPPGVPHQLLAAYRIPDGAKAPATVTATAQYLPYDAFYDGANRGRRQDVPLQSATITFRRNAGYEAKLPAYLETSSMPSAIDAEGAFLPAGRQVAGYVSDVVPGHIVGELTLTGAFGLPEGSAADQPFSGPFNHMAVMGSRWAGTAEHDEAFTRFFAFVDGEIILRSRGRAIAPVEQPDDERLDPNRPVDCGTEPERQRAVRAAARGGLSETIFEVFSQVDFTVCGVTEIPDEAIGENPQDVDAAIVWKGTDTATRDLRVLPGEGFAEQGSAVSVPFKVRSAGSEGGELTATVTTTLPGVAQQQRTMMFPSAGEHATPVALTLPADAAPGTYAVTLSIGSGAASRSATGSVVVLPKPSAPGGAKQTPRDNVWMGRDGSVAFGLVCASDCGKQQSDVLSMKAGIAPTANTAAVSKPRLLRIAAKRSFQTTSGKRTRAKVTLFPKARKAVQKGRTVKAVLVIRNSKGVPTVRRLVIRSAARRQG